MVKAGTMKVSKPTSTRANELLRAIRSKCVECCGNVVAEVAKCKVSMCPLHGYRGGPHLASNES